MKAKMMAAPAASSMCCRMVVLSWMDGGKGAEHSACTNRSGPSPLCVMLGCTVPGVDGSTVPNGANGAKGSIGTIPVKKMSGPRPYEKY